MEKPLVSLAVMTELNKRVAAVCAEFDFEGGLLLLTRPGELMVAGHHTCDEGGSRNGQLLGIVTRGLGNNIREWRQPGFVAGKPAGQG